MFFFFVTLTISRVVAAIVVIARFCVLQTFCTQFACALLYRPFNSTNSGGSNNASTNLTTKCCPFEAIKKNIETRTENCVDALIASSYVDNYKVFAVPTKKKKGVKTPTMCPTTAINPLILL